jgi:hypothetical protein
MGRYWRLARDVALIAAALLIIDRVSRLFAPCAVYYPSGNYDAGGAYQNHCALYRGVISAGAALVADLDTGTWTAIATLAIAIFTYTLYRETNRQARLTRESIDLARAEFVTTFRPKMAIRSMSVSAIEPQKPISIELYIANVGGSTANIRRRNVTILMHRQSNPLPPRPAYDPEMTVPERIQLVVGGSIKITATTAARSLPSEATVQAIGRGQILLYVIGYVIFVDDNDGPGECAFCRVYNRVTNRFGRPDGPIDADYEYEDYT